uniref:Uncharacterized protein n=1 Tax=Rhizophora mucronata TaxID=61149 RepID=A0A2P2R4A2_RHIMU
MESAIEISICLVLRQLALNNWVVLGANFDDF